MPASIEVTVARFEFPAEKIIPLTKGERGKVERSFKIRSQDDAYSLHWTASRSGLVATSVANSSAVRMPLDVYVPKPKPDSKSAKLVIEVARHGAKRPYFTQDAWFE